MKHPKILIVGGGLAGIGCARELNILGEKNFILLSKDLGGRAPRSDRTIPRATFYARTEYKNMWPFLKLGRKADIWKGRLVTKEKIWRPLFIAFRHPVLSVRFYFITRRFDACHTRFMSRCETMSQKQAMEADPYLLDLYKQSATDFLRKNSLVELQNELIGTLVRVTRFIRIEEANAFLMLWIWLILVKNGRECTIDIRKMVEGFLPSIIDDEARSIIDTGNGWLVNGDIECDVLVMATPINITKMLLGDSSLPEQKATKVFSSIVKGKPRAIYSQGRYNVLPAEEKDVVVVQNEDGTYLFCSTQEKYNLEKYFETFEVVERKNWDPAGFFGDRLIEAKRSERLYVIGDYHFPGLESAYLTGIQAARSISKG